MRTLVLILLLGFLSSTTAKSQSAGGLVKPLNEQVQIDSQVAIIDGKMNCLERISEGEIRKKGKNVGGFSTYSLFDKKTKRLVRIRHHKAIDLNRETTFYYVNDKVIFAKVEITDRNSSDKMKIAYVAKYYFNNDKSIGKISENNKYSNASDILNEGKKYLEKYYQDLREDESIFKH